MPPSFVLDPRGTRAFSQNTRPGEHGWNFYYEVRVWNAASGRLESTRTILASGFGIRTNAGGNLRAFLANSYYLDAGSVLSVEGAAALGAVLRGDRRLALDVELALDRTGRFLAFETPREGAAVWDAKNPAEPVIRLSGVGGGQEVGALSITPDGRFVVELLDDGVLVHRVRDGALLEARSFFAAGAKAFPSLFVRATVGITRLQDFWE